MKEPKNYYKKIFIVTVGTIVLFLVAGIAYKLGMMSASCKIITLFQAKTSFFSNSWSVYTTIFGIFGVILGVVFPIYNSKEQEERYRLYKKEYEEYFNYLKIITDAEKEKLEKIESIRQDILKNEEHRDSNDSDKLNELGCSKFIARLQEKGLHTSYEYYSTYFINIKR